jgi:hypothetical protein
LLGEVDKGIGIVYGEEINIKRRNSEMESVKVAKIYVNSSVK